MFDRGIVPSHGREQPGMQTFFIILGAIGGSWLADLDRTVFGVFAGGIIAYLLAKQRATQAKFAEFEKELDRLAQRSPPAVSKTVTTQAPVQAPPVSLYERDEPPASTDSKPSQRAASTPSMSTRPESAARPPRAPGPVEKLLAAAKGWLTTGNVPVKIGVIVSFFGVAFLLKYAVEHQVLVVPIEIRYLLVAMSAGVLLAIGWRLRTRLRVYALSLQGGGIGILYLTIFAAFRVHPLLPAPFAFALLVLLTAGAGVLAVLQDARALAVLGIVGGFLAPVLVSTGSGNHVALFSYYLLLNSAILGIAWYRSWRDLNLIGFVFTFGVATMWGYEYYRPELFASTEPFLVVHFLFYQAIAILFAFRQPPNLRGIVDGTLVFGTPVVAFALQSQLLEGSEYGLAISAMVVAIAYTLTALWLHRSQGKSMRLLVESFVALAVAFATISIPLALDDRWTAVAWALEGAALVWVGVRQQGMLAKLSGTALIGASGFAFVADGWHTVATPVINGNFLGGMLISVSSVFSAHYLTADKTPMRMQAWLAVPLLLWGLAWWGGTGTAEIMDRAPDDAKLHLLTAFIAASVGLLAWMGRHYDWTAARRATLGFLPVLPVIALLYLIKHDHLLAGAGTLSWLAAIAAHFALLRIYDNGRGRLEGLWHFAGAIFFISVISYEVHWRVDVGFSDVWAASAAILTTLLGAVLIIFGRERLSWPLQRYWNAYLAAAVLMVAFQVFAIAVAGIDDPGDPAPIPYIPILNPFDLLTLAGLTIAIFCIQSVQSTSNWLGQDRQLYAYIGWGLVAFLLSTIAVVRATHHFTDVPWDSWSLSHSVSVQSSLSIYWAILGLGGMIVGARRSLRWVWLTGAALMALVVAKLFLVDLGNTGTVARIVSFLGVGVMLLVVGYFAPAPPRTAEEVASNE